MNARAPEKTYTIRPSWKEFFWGYVLSVLMIPVAGLGLVALYYVRRSHRQIQYIVGDNYILSQDAEVEQRIDLVNIRQTTISQTWLQARLHIGTLEIESSTDTMILRGLTDASQLKRMLDQAIKAQMELQRDKQRTASEETEEKPLNNDQIDYLTGLWQEGLISEEEYRQQRKSFE